ncbi:hypothetical protein CAPTEDRAFT_225808 [Capitella teleta]|uniref:Multidrug and toxin extrusion protein n=1 Tax=Capitella teleta TaxID=283909 RepID=R7T6F9_CAPTE|nr:hypothetical protein CAPTEDRAFT_225808 [Capitella teleta]|eukprot:ELT89060.1 hypothetical protein CAPTEDRAFT_225808 [Capitella teleta]
MSYEFISSPAAYWKLLYLSLDPIHVRRMAGGAMSDTSERQEGPLYQEDENEAIMDRDSYFTPLDACSMSWREFYAILFPDGYKTEFRKFVKIGIPMTSEIDYQPRRNDLTLDNIGSKRVYWYPNCYQIFAIFCQIVIQPLAIIFGGHMGLVELSTLGLANSIISALCNTMFIGLTSACDTLFSQVGGKNNKVYLGILVQRSIVAFSLICFILYGINLNMATFLIAMGQDPEISVRVGRYLVWFMPAVPTLFILKVARNYGVVYGDLKSFFVSGFAAVILSIIFNVLFVNVCEFGLIGSAFAQNIAFVVSTAAYVLYIVLQDYHRKFFPAWNWRLFENWGEFFELAITGVLMTSLEMWAFEISVFLAGLLGPVELSAQSIVFNLDLLLYALPGGLCVTCTIRTGQCLGAGRPTEARSACYVAISCISITTLVSTILFATLRYELPKLFTNDKEVIALAAELLPFVAFYNVFMNLSIVMRGLLQGIGKQRVGSLVVTISYYVLALPIGGCLMFLTPLRTKGLWVIFCCVLVLNSAVYIIYLVRCIDWVELSGLAQRRARHGEFEDTKPDERTGLVSTESTSDREKILNSSEARSKSSAEWLAAEMPRALKIKSTFYIAIPVIFFVFCIFFKLFFSYDEDAIIFSSMPALLRNGTIMFNATAVTF